MNEVINKKVNFIDLGPIDYQAAWDYQESLFDEIVKLKIANRKAELSEQKASKKPPAFRRTSSRLHLGKKRKARKSTSG